MTQVLHQYRAVQAAGVRHRWTLRVTAACLLSLMGVNGWAQDRSEVPLSTPHGVMLVDVMQFINNTSAQYLWRRLGDENGKPLYTYDQDKPGKASCTAECAREFPAFLAPADARPTGDWTLIKRSAGELQWAYQGKALYRYSGTDPVGEPAVSGGNSGDTDDPRYHDPGSELFSPKAGWRRAAFTPEATAELPAGIEMRSMTMANGYALVAADTGGVIYQLDDSSPDFAASQWTAVYAPALAARDIGRFSIITRRDGRKQWAYQGKALYTYRGDYARNDLNGLLAGAGAQPALVYRHFMPDEVEIRHLPLRGPLLVTADNGHAIYGQTRYHLQYGGRQMREGYRHTYLDAKAVGPQGCAGECARTWHPLQAPENARSAGFWEIAARPDGTRQWVFRGAHLYTFTGDQKPGDVFGNNRHDILWGDAGGTVDLSPAGDGDPRYNEGAGFYWRTAGLYN